MRKLIIAASGLFCSAMLLISCQKDATGDGNISYTFKATNLDASLATSAAGSGLVVAAGSNGSIGWSAATINVKKAELSAKKEQVAVNFESKDITNVDLLSLGTLSGTVSVPTGTYGDVEVKLTLAESATNMPLVLKGTYTEASGTKIPVEFRFNEALELKLKGQQFIVKGDKYIVTVTLELNNLVKGIEASGFGQTTRTNGTILVTSSINRPLYEKLRANLVLVGSVQIAH